MRMIATLLVALAFWISGAGIATAHTALASSDPAKDVILTSPPTAITLTFTEDINPAFANILVSSSSGRDYTSGPPQVIGPEIRAALRPDIPSTGVYTVGYRVVSADGHPVAGTFTFTIAGIPQAPLPASTAVGAPPTTAPAPPSAAPAGPDTKKSILTAAVAGLALGGAIAFWQSRKHRRKNTVDDEPRSVDPPPPGDEMGAR